MVAYWAHIPDILVRVEASAILTFVSQMVKTSGFHPEDGGFDSPTNDAGVTPLRLKQKALNMGGVAQLVEREKCSPSMILIVDNAVEVGLLQRC